LLPQIRDASLEPSLKTHTSPKQRDGLLNSPCFQLHLLAPQATSFIIPVDHFPTSELTRARLVLFDIDSPSQDHQGCPFAVEAFYHPSLGNSDAAPADSSDMQGCPHLVGPVAQVVATGTLVSSMVSAEPGGHRSCATSHAFAFIAGCHAGWLCCGVRALAVGRSRFPRIG